MEIAGRKIGQGQPPYLICEVSCNHCGDFIEAKRLIDAAKLSGADAVKFQCYEPDEITLACNKPDFIIKDGPWKGRQLHELYTKAHTPRSWFPELFDHAKMRDITMFASVFSPEGVDFLEHLGCPAYKIASMEIVDLPLIQRADKTGKPLIISTGMATDDEVFAATWDNGQCSEHAVLHCVSGYPTPVRESGLGLLRARLDHYMHAGISDHTLGWEVAVAATVMGAEIIERHFTLSRGNGSEDSDFSLTPTEFRHMATAVRDIWAARFSAAAPASEESSRQLRRSLYVVEDIKAGEMFTDTNVRSIRPAYGLPPRMLPEILKMRAGQDIERGTPLAPQYIKGWDASWHAMWAKPFDFSQEPKP